MRTTPATPLSEMFLERVRPALLRVTSHDYFVRATTSSLTLTQCRAPLLGFYPLIAGFPDLMRATLDHMNMDVPGADRARRWIRANLRVEKQHATWWIDWASAFGISADDLAQVKTDDIMNGAHRYLYELTRSGPAADAIAATNYALEGATGIWTRDALAGMSRQGEAFGFTADARALRWLHAHAHYDDRHPIEALEIVKIFARDEASIESAAAAATQSLDHVAAALTHALQAS